MWEKISVHKHIKFRLLQVVIYNLLQLVETTCSVLAASLWIKSFDNQLVTRLVFVFSRFASCWHTVSLVLGEDEQVKGSHSILIWGGEEQERLYSVVDCKTGIDQVPQTLCFGPRVACLAKVGDRYWLGTEVSFEDWQYSMPFHTVPHPTVSYRTILYHTIPYYTIPYQTIPYHTIPYNTIPYHTIPYHTTPHHTTPHHTIPYHTTPQLIRVFCIIIRVLLSKCSVAQGLVATWKFFGRSN